MKANAGTPQLLKTGFQNVRQNSENRQGSGSVQTAWTVQGKIPKQKRQTRAKKQRTYDSL